MILADTSIWIDHLRTSLPSLVTLLERGQVLMHPFIVGELACGTLQNRREVLYLLANLPRTPVATEDEVLGFIEGRALMGKGIGYVDVHLLASVLLSPSARLWTRDRRLAEIAAGMQLNFADDQDGNEGPV